MALILIGMTKAGGVPTLIARSRGTPMTPRPKSLGFGFVPSESEHHFLVMIPSYTHESIYVSEHLAWVDSAPWREMRFALAQEDATMRVVLPRRKWEAIADPVRAE